MALLLRHKLLIAAATVVAAASAGGAYAATQSGPDPRQAFLNDVAKRLNVPPTRLRSALRAALLDRLEAAVKAGQLTQAQANRIEQRLRSGRLPLFFGPRGHFGLRAHGFGGHGALQAAASYLGLSDFQLLSDLRSGQSLAQIARARDKSVSGLERAMVSAEKARLDRAVSAGLITKAQEQRLLSRLSARFGRLVNRTGFAPRMAPDGPPPSGPTAGPGVEFEPPPAA